MNLPAIHLLRQAHPKSWITLMVDAPLADLVKNHADLDEVFVVDSKRFCSERPYRIQILRQLRPARFDAAIAAQASKHIHWMIFRAGIPIRVGWKRKWPFLLTRAIRDDKSMRIQHETKANLALAEALTKLKWDGSFSLPLDENTAARIDSKIRAELGNTSSIAVIHPGTSHPAKRWPEQRFSELCHKLLHEQIATPVLIGGAEEIPVSRSVANQSKGILDWTGALNLKELSAFLAHPRVKCLVSSDSGPVHVAWLHHKPVIGLYAKNLAGSDPARWGPLSKNSAVIHKPISDIQTDEVWPLLRKCLSE